MEPPQPLTPDHLHALCHGIAVKGLENLEGELERYHRLPLLGESRALVFGILQHVASLTFIHAARMQLSGYDLSPFIPPDLPQDPQQPPPSPI